MTHLNHTMPQTATPNMPQTTPPVAMTQLQGQDLLAHIKSQPQTASREDLAMSAGYVTTTKTGQTRILTNKFFAALLEAKGDLPPSSRPSSGGPTPSYIATIHGNGQIVIGKAYVSQLPEHTPGAEFQIQLTEEGGILLSPV